MPFDALPTFRQCCRTCGSDFLIDAPDQSFYAKINVPWPTLCPTCRMQRRLSYRNDRSLFHTQCSLTKKPIISMYDPDRGLTVYDYHVWWEQDWDPFKYGCDYDPDNSFFAQIVRLRQVVPRFNLFNRKSENSDYVNYAPHCKDCYLLFGAWFNENCHYGQTLNECRNCLDCLFLDKSELCYENIDCTDSYNAHFCQNSSNAVDSYFCYDCHHVKNCIGCYNLRNKEYHVENLPVSKETFEELRCKFASYDFLQRYRLNFDQTRKKRAVHRYAVIINSEEASGDFIYNSKNAKSSFSVYRSEDVAYCSRCFDQKSSYDSEGGGKSELVYEGMSNDFAFHSIGSMTCEGLTDSHYCDLCFNCTSCFGCIGLQRASYCILNRQYSRVEYDQLVGRIMAHMREAGEWGEFFPVEHSMFGYNETLAQEYFPLTEEGARAKGYQWKNRELQAAHSTTSLPDTLHETQDTVIKAVLSCRTCSKNYKVMPLELRFLREAHIALPRDCPTCRHTARMRVRNPRKLWQRNCDGCGKDIRSSFNPSGQERSVLCEDCYLIRLV